MPDSPDSATQDEPIPHDAVEVPPWNEDMGRPPRVTVYPARGRRASRCAWMVHGGMPR